MVPDGPSFSCNSSRVVARSVWLSCGFFGHAVGRVRMSTMSDGRSSFSCGSGTSSMLLLSLPISFTSSDTL